MATNVEQHKQQRLSPVCTATPFVSQLTFTKEVRMILTINTQATVCSYDARPQFQKCRLTLVELKSVFLLEIL